MTDLDIFVAVAEAGSFTGAAEALNSTVASTSRRIRGLEQRLGSRLFNRTTRRVSLTEAGEIYYQQVRRMLNELRDTEERLSELAAEPRGQLRITAPLSYGVSRLGPLVASFAARHSGLQIQLQLDDRRVDIVDAGHDLALRIGQLLDSSLVARPIADIPLFICASPRYLDRHGTPRRPSDLPAHNCLHYNNVSLREEWRLRETGATRSIAVKGSFCSNNGDVLCQAATEGLGIALLPDFIVERRIAEGRLVRILVGFEPRPLTLYALYPSRHFVPGKIKLFLDFLAGALGPEPGGPGIP